VSGRSPGDRAPRILVDVDFTQDEPLYVDSPRASTATVQLFTTDDLHDFTLDLQSSASSRVAPRIATG